MKPEKALYSYYRMLCGAESAAANSGQAGRADAIGDFSQAVLDAALEHELPPYHAPHDLCRRQAA